MRFRIIHIGEIYNISQDTGATPLKYRNSLVSILYGKGMLCLPCTTLGITHRQLNVYFPIAIKSDSSTYT